MNKNKLIMNQVNHLDNVMDTNTFWYKSNNVEKVIMESDLVGFYKENLLDSALSESTILSNMHIYEKWRDFLHNKTMPELCNVKGTNFKCLECPHRNMHVNYCLKVFNITAQEFFDNRYSPPINIIKKVTNQQLKTWFKEFINIYRTTPKKNGSMRSSNTIVVYIKQIKRWQKLMNKETGSNYDFANSIKIKETQTIIEPISPTDLQELTTKILNNSNNLTSDILGAKRLKAVYFLMLQTGLRLNEVCLLDKNNFKVLSDYTGELQVHGKGSKKRTVGLSHESVLFIQEYLKERNRHIIDTNPALFLNSKFQRMKKNSIIGMFKRISKKLNINFSAHALRRTSASLRVVEGADTLDLMNNFGWKSENVARRYVHSAKNIESINKQKNFNPYSANQKLIDNK